MHAVSSGACVYLFMYMYMYMHTCPQWPIVSRCGKIQCYKIYDRTSCVNKRMIGATYVCYSSSDANAWLVHVLKWRNFSKSGFSCWFVLLERSLRGCLPCMQPTHRACKVNPCSCFDITVDLLTLCTWKHTLNSMTLTFFFFFFTFNLCSYILFI